MSFSAGVSINIQSSDFSVSEQINIVGEAKSVFVETIAPGTNNREIPIGVDVSQSQLIAIRSDVALTIKTNSSSTPDDTIVLAAGKMQFFFAGAFFASPITEDVSSIFVTNSTTSPGVLQFLVIQNLA